MTPSAARYTFTAQDPANRGTELLEVGMIHREAGESEHASRVRAVRLVSRITGDGDRVATTDCWTALRLKNDWLLKIKTSDRDSYGRPVPVLAIGSGVPDDAGVVDELASGLDGFATRHGIALPTDVRQSLGQATDSLTADFAAKQAANRRGLRSVLRLRP